jgi:hypothetical protein
VTNEKQGGPGRWQMVGKSAKVHCHDAENMKNLKKQWCGKHFASPILID